VCVRNTNDNFFISFFTDITSNIEITEIETFLTEKENRNYEISLGFRAKRIIITPSRLFIFSYRKEIDRLLAQGIYKLIYRSAKEISNT
jgi:hypothetical protein